jgi:MSHA biogenesis protein MshQ
MPITFVAASSAAAVASTSITVPVPAGVTTGDFLIASIAVRGNPTVNAPAGWTLIRSDANGSTMRLSTFRRFVTTTEPATHVFTFTKSSTASSAGIAAYRGVDPTTPVDVHGGQVTTKAGTKLTAPTVTATVAGTKLISVFGSAIDATATPPTGMTERYDRLSVGSSKVSVTADDQTLAAAGATGVRTVALDKSTTGLGQDICLRPAP